MKKVNDFDKIAYYYNKYEMDRLFDTSMLGKLELIQFNRLEYLCREEQPMPYLMFVVEGKAKVFRTLANGKSLLVSFYEPFEVMGEAEMLEETTTFSNAQAISNCYVLALEMEKAKKELGKDLTFLRFIGSGLAEKLYSLGSASSVNLLYPLENRLAKYILMAAVRSLKNQREQLIFNENLTHLSELLGTSYRHLLRILNGMCSQGILAKDEKAYIVLDENKLESLAGDLF